MIHPKNLNEAFGLAKIQEEYLKGSHRSQRPSFDFAKPSILGPRPEGKMESRLKLPLEMLSPTQMEEKKGKDFVPIVMRSFSLDINVSLLSFSY